MAGTTLDIATDVLDELKRRRRGQDKTLGELVSELLAQALADHPTPSTRPLRWQTQDFGPRIDLEDKEALRRALEGS